MCHNPYYILGVSEGSSASVIQEAYRKRASRCRPHKLHSPSERHIKHDEFLKLRKAYDALSQDKARRNTGTLARSGACYKRPAAHRTSVTRWCDDMGVPVYRRPIGVATVSGSINGRRVDAIPDTGAACNIMSAALARSLGFVIPDCQSHQLRMANGKRITTVGAIEAEWQFSNSDDDDKCTNHKTEFHIMHKFIHDVVLGSAFLRATSTLSKHRHRLHHVSQPPQPLSVFYVNSLGPVPQRLQGSINGSSVAALPDSGSEPNLLSLDFVNRQDWIHHIDASDVRLVRFPDGSVQRTSGSVRAAWGLEGKGARMVEWHILQGCMYDAIVGQDVLEGVDVFGDAVDGEDVVQGWWDVVCQTPLAEETPEL